MVHSLKEKGIDAFAVDNLSDLINFIKDNHVDYVGLSVNHPNENTLVETLKASKAPFFSFAEDALPLSAKKLAASAAPTKVTGVASAYTLWMILGPIVKARSTNKDNFGGKVILASSQEKETYLGAVNVEDYKYTMADGTIVQLGSTEKLGVVATLNVKLLKDALQRTLTPLRARDLNKGEKFAPYQKITVFSVVNEGDDGLLIVASNGSEFTPEPRINHVRDTLVKEMNNKNFKVGAVVDMAFASTDITEWIRSYCQFSYVYSDNGQTQIAGFFNCKEVLPKFSREENGMYSTQVRTLPLNLALVCDLYLYFNRNEKLLPYIKQGDVITKDKLERLEVSGVEDVHVREEDKPKLETFMFGLILNTTLAKAAKAG